MFPEMKLCSLVPESTFMYLLGNYILLRLVLGRLIVGIYIASQIHECGNWETEYYNSVLEITVFFWEYIL